MTEDSFVSSVPHVHEWSLPVGAGIYRCMTCGVERTSLPTVEPTSKPHSELVETVRRALREASYASTEDGLAALDSLEEQLEAREFERDAVVSVNRQFRERLEAAQSAMRRARHELDQWVFADGSAAYRVQRAEDILDDALGVSSPASSPLNLSDELGGF